MSLRSFFVLFLGIGSFSAFSQPGKKTITLEADGQPIINFETSSHDFGTITEGTKATYEFKFTNTGKAPLILTDVKPPCSCTTPDWPKDPIEPGKSAVIKVTFDSKGKPGTFSKTIAVYHNGESGTDYITIKGFVGT
ncbi:MAG: DUF1573 domain-containing protein [Flavobacteriales bacterium]|nr:DUF1573 domain-containing protein [Flavobacteriales bacterium]